MSDNHWGQTPPPNTSSTGKTVLITLAVAVGVVLVASMFFAVFGVGGDTKEDTPKPKESNRSLCMSKLMDDYVNVEDLPLDRPSSGPCSKLSKVQYSDVILEVSERMEPNGGNDPAEPAPDPEADEEKDVSVGDLKSDGFGTYTVPVTYTNHSSKTSDYSISFRYLDADGTQVGEDVDYVTGVKPGAKAVSELMLVDKNVSKVEIVSVDRTESVG